MPKTGYKQTEEHRRNIGLAFKGCIGYWRGKKRSKKTINKIINNLVIHHINGNHNDNRPLNRMKLSRSEHMKIHAIMRKLKKGKKNIK